MKRLAHAVLTVLSFACGTLPVFAADHCLALPPGSEIPAVTACETDTDYVFDLAGDRYVYAKASYRERLGAAINIWLTGHGIEETSGATVAFFLASPEINPRATQARAEVRLADGRTFVAYVGIDPDEWQLEDRRVGILDEGDAYPGDYGNAAGYLLVKHAPGASLERVGAFLARHGATQGEPFTAGWSSFRCEVFAELATIESALADPLARSNIERIGRNAILEWIATRGLAFTFPLTETAEDVLQ